jgi:hypothetical protein
MSLHLARKALAALNTPKTIEETKGKLYAKKKLNSVCNDKPMK